MNQDTPEYAHVVAELFAANQELLESIMAGDWETYATLCDETITAFEPESAGTLVEGMPFHRFYFDQGGLAKPYNVTMSSPHVRLLGDDAAVLSYVRLVQRLDDAGHPVTRRCEETRVWQRTEHGWRHVHFHRTVP